jgi:hypothetical protein
MDIYLDGAQVELQPLATPFVTSSNTRAVGKITANTEILNSTQG